MALSFPDYFRVRQVSSFEALMAMPFDGGVNALCWPRQLAGDFDALAGCFAHFTGITPLDAELFEAYADRMNPGAKLAASCILEDLARLSAQGLQPSVECVPAYPRDAADAVVATDVYSFHADRAPVQADTYLCSYNEAATEALPNEEAFRCIDDAATRAALLAGFDAATDGDFDSYLRENCFDLHYGAKPAAKPYSFGFGHLWRIAIEYPSCPVPPCIHRAPETKAGRPPRLLLIS